MSAPWVEPLRVNGDRVFAMSGMCHAFIRDESGETLARVDVRGDSTADKVRCGDRARALVHRANAYDALVEALTKAKGDIEMAAARRSYNAGLGASDWESCLQTWERETLRDIDAALALASPEKTEGER